MKFDLKNKTNRFAQRTLAAFSERMMKLLETKPFEKITVNEICEACNYPRATFYNYFDDSYDLLNYCWMAVTQEIRIDDYPDMKTDQRVYILFDRIYDYLDGYRGRIRKIMNHNQMDGALVASMNFFIKQQTCQIMQTCSCQDILPVPFQLVAEHYSNTLELVIEWCFLRERLKTKEEASRCLHFLLDNIQEDESE